MNQNLEASINKLGYEIAENKINEIDKILSILVNDGVYAFYKYIESKNMTDLIIIILKDEEIKNLFNIKNENVVKFFEELSNNLFDLLFFREILEKILIYARYHLKAKGEK